MLGDHIEATGYLQSCRLELQAAWILWAVWTGWTGWPIWAMRTGHQSSSWQRSAVWCCSIITSGSVSALSHTSILWHTALCSDPAVTDPPSFYQGNSPSPLFLHTFYHKKEEANTELQWMLSQHGNQPNSILAAWFKCPACFYVVIKNTVSGRGPCSSLVMLPYFWSLLAQYQNYRPQHSPFLTFILN